MTFATFLFLLLGKKISLKERLLLKESLNNVSLAGIVKLVKRILIFTAVIEIIGGIILAYSFFFRYANWKSHSIMVSSILYQISIMLALI